MNTSSVDRDETAGVGAKFAITVNQQCWSTGWPPRGEPAGTAEQDRACDAGQGNLCEADRSAASKCQRARGLRYPGEWHVLVPSRAVPVLCFGCVRLPRGSSLETTTEGSLGPLPSLRNSSTSSRKCAPSSRFTAIPRPHRLGHHDREEGCVVARRYVRPAACNAGTQLCQRRQDDRLGRNGR